jgi:hypothetical protein
MSGITTIPIGTAIAATTTMVTDYDEPLTEVLLLVLAVAVAVVAVLTYLLP